MSDPNKFDQIYDQDSPRAASGGRIQWKGTDVCIDLWCACGEYAHFDGDFFYHYRCWACGQRFAVGEVIKLIPLTDEQAQDVERQYGGDSAWKGGDDA